MRVDLDITLRGEAPDVRLTIEATGDPASASNAHVGPTAPRPERGESAAPPPGPSLRGRYQSTPRPEPSG
jgi:hypothetical protein